MKLKEVQVKETYQYNTVSLTAECDHEVTDEEILKLRARARKLVEVMLVKKKEVIQK